MKTRPAPYKSGTPAPPKLWAPLAYAEYYGDPSRCEKCLIILAEAPGHDCSKVTMIEDGYGHSEGFSWQI